MSHCAMPLFTPVHPICANGRLWDGCPDNPDIQTWTLGNSGSPKQSTQPGLSPCDVYITATVMGSGYRAGGNRSGAKQLKLWARAQKEIIDLKIHSLKII